MVNNVAKMRQKLRRILSGHLERLGGEIDETVAFVAKWVRERL